MQRVKQFSLRSEPAVWLVGITLGYLALPLFLFCLGWLQATWAIFFTLITAVGLWSAIAAFQHEAALVVAFKEWRQTLTSRGAAVTILVCLLVILISGVGGYGYQTGDWTKHEILLKDLVDYPWPVFYDYYGTTIGVAYYVAYYLPSAVIGKLAGVLAANQAMVVWTLLGLLLSVFWFAIITKRSVVVGLSIFLLFSGLSVIGALLRFSALGDLLAGTPVINTSPWQTHPALWSAIWQYSPHVRGLFWVPQHVLPGWLLTGMILFVLLTTNSRRTLLFLWALSTLWSPFITIGLTPFFLADLLPRPQSRFADRLRAYVSVANGCGLALFLLMAAFYATKLTPIAPVLNQGLRVGLSLGEIVQRDGWVRVLFLYLLFCLLEFGLYFLLDGYRSLREMPELRWTYRLVFLWLAGLPLLILGQNNDLASRASIPALFFVAMMVGRNGFWLSGAAPWRRYLWPVVILLGALSPLYEVGYQIALTYQRGTLYAFELNPNRNLAEKYVLDAATMQQYASSVDTFFFQHLAKGGAPATRAATAAYLFDDRITLVDSLLARQQAEPGEQLDLLLLWRAVKPIAHNYSVAVRLLDIQGTVWWEHQAWPAGAPTSTWEVARRIWYDHHAPTLPQEMPAGLYRLEIYLTDPDTQAKLPVRKIVTGESMGDIVPLTYVQVGSPASAPAYPLPASAEFSREIALVGSTLPPQMEANPGDELTVTLTWRALDRPRANYTGFVQLLDGEGRLVAQHDHPLTNNFIPATLWQPGLTVTDDYLLRVPPEASPGRYQLIVGLYEGATGARLTVMMDSTAVGDTVTIGNMTVRE
ncbi:MAG: hypothetical protein DYG89_07410 [Caldilinea sp. CFX5]|nr:hypothetical protein [Caldilinea sp. CFX5]